MHYYNSLKCLSVAPACSFAPKENSFILFGDKWKWWIPCILEQLLQAAGIIKHNSLHPNSKYATFPEHSFQTYNSTEEARQG